MSHYCISKWITMQSFFLLTKGKNIFEKEMESGKKGVRMRTVCGVRCTNFIKELFYNEIRTPYVVFPSAVFSFRFSVIVPEAFVR
jgi:hypothetical protein